MTDPRLFAPAAARNRDAIRDVLRGLLPETGLLLEVASGSGEHALHFAAALPGLLFQPSDPAPENRASIDAWASGMPNIRPAIALDATSPDWPISQADAVLCINMIHIAPWTACEGLVRGAAALDAMLILYGPFRREGRHTAPSNAEFDESLRTRDPAWGVRDIEAVAALAAAHGYAAPEVIHMPANNLTVAFRRAAAR